MTLTHAKKWLPGIAITLLLTAAALLQFGRAPEWTAFQMGLWLVPQRPPNADVTVVGVDSAALRKHGPWPWPRSLLAQLTDQLAADKARVIAFAPEFSAPQNAAALDYLKQLETLPALGRNQNASALITEARTALDTDAAFTASIQAAGNVILAAHGAPADGAAPGAPPPWLVFKTRLSSPDQAAISNLFFDPLRVSVRAPLAALGQAADGVGYLSDASPGGLTPLAVSDGEQLLPSFSLLVAARDLGFGNSAIVPQAGGISLGDQYLFSDAHLRVWPRPYPAGNGRGAIPVYAFDAVLSGRIGAESLAGKTVIVGLTADAAHSLTLAAAGLVSNILNDDLLATPVWAWWLRGLLTLLVGAYLLAGVTRLRLWVGVAASVAALIVLLNAEFIPLISRDLWLPLIWPVLFLILGHGAVLAVRFLRDWHGVPHEQFSETSRQLALACQTQGRYDEALAHYIECLPSAKLYENLLSLGHEHERHRHYPQAIEVYTEMQRRLSEFGSIEERLRKLQALDNQTTATPQRGVPIALLESGLQKPLLGRYELVRELGRGAMSVVYLGRDQKINRTVAIKTLALREEFQGGVPEEISRRFFREAEAAGRLNHPNIVTIYDVGEDQGLAYIAMDYLAGESLQHYAVPGALLPMDEVMAIVIKIAEALDYAHGRDVVHRDIKPANIMYERQTGRLKITDFGVASLANVTRTRTGTILGSPSYMSPEQVAGRKADGRSDLYSLAVTLYQLLRGELPFDAPSLTGLMFKISNTPPPDVTFLRPDIPAQLRDVVERALQKNPDARYQTGVEMANALRQCRSKLRRAG